MAGCPRAFGRAAVGRLGALLPAMVASLLAAAVAVPTSGQAQTMDKSQPAFYQADRATYDREAGVATLEGHVEFWQGDRILLADRVTYDRNTDTAAAQGNVVLLEPGGQTVFSDYAELTDQMKNGVLTHMQSLLAENGRLVANGGRRTDAKINELTRPVYTTCNLCADDPTKPPLWQIRAREGVQDTENKMIEYRDAEVDLFGYPVAYFPYLSHPDPSEKRATGLLVPTIGLTNHLGAFVNIPYYWVLDGQSDLLVTGEVGTRNGPSVDAVYRRRFNDGTVTINGAIGRIGDGVGGYVFNKGQFNIDDTWRWGFDINRASSIQYMRDFRVAGTQSTLTSQVYLEGFGQGAYTRLDARAYQPLTSTLNNDHLPFVLPRYSYSYFGEPDALGGRSSAELGFFNVLRNSGTNTQRGRASFAWNDSPTGRLGDRWTFTLNVDSAAYTAQDFNLTPNYGAQSNVQSAQAMPTAAAMLRWPFQRDAGSWGTQILEPMAQIIVAPQGSSYLTTQIPNEDSLDQDFTDANLFSLNRFPGVDRLEGGPRANVALHGVWFLPNGANLDALIGQAYRTRDDFAFNVNSGLRKTASDVVTHLAYTPNANFDIMTRERFDHRTGQIRYVDAVATTGPSWLRLNTGYLYTPDDPYQFYDSNPPPTAVTTPRNEVQAGASTRFGVWRGDINARRDLQSNKMVSLGVGGAYEDECVIFDVHYFRRYTSIAGDSGSTTILFQVTLKTVGQFGFHAQ